MFQIFFRFYFPLQVLQTVKRNYHWSKSVGIRGSTVFRQLFRWNWFWFSSGNEETSPWFSAQDKPHYAPGKKLNWINIFIEEAWKKFNINSGDPNTGVTDPYWLLPVPSRVPCRVVSKLTVIQLKLQFTLLVIKS